MSATTTSWKVIGPSLPNRLQVSQASLNSTAESAASIRFTTLVDTESPFSSMPWGALEMKDKTDTVVRIDE